MKREQMVVACCSDLAGKVRGKAFPAVDFDKRLRRGVGWTPTNVQITCFDNIAESPFGSLGDLVLIPDPSTRVRLPVEGEGTAEEFVLGDIKHTDGTPWAFCTRSILKAALARLERVAGLTLVGAFEHEFQFRNLASPLGDAFSLAGFREHRAFAETLIAAMREAGLAPDTFMKEFGTGQFEVTMGPQQGVAIADHAVVVRECARAVGHRLGRFPTFTPIRDPAGVGNGVHIHLSFRDGQDQPAAYDPQGQHGLSKPAGQFVAGILRYLESIVALTAPSVISYVRLTPHRWSAAFNNLGFRDREASVRICPVSDLSDVDQAAQFNFEYRAADAAASPHLQLAAIVHAGVQGIEDDLPTPGATEEDLSLLAPDVLKARGCVRLPQSLPEALDRFSAHPKVAEWFSAEFVELYVKHKHGEISFLNGRDLAETCKAYEEVY
ncbi:MAG TPA: glutamine synthetase family protein [Propylenella sp.]|nr:glutamine synthetase family protein [Propylenella sp.]